MSVDESLQSALAALPSSYEQLSTLAVLVGIPVALFQLHQARQLDRGRNTIELLKNLSGPELMQARYAMQAIDLNKPFEEFTVEERIACSLVCASFALAGTLSRKKLVDTQAVIETWGPSVQKNHQRLGSFIAGRRAAYGVAGNAFWRDFDWLARKCSGA